MPEVPASASFNVSQSMADLAENAKSAAVASPVHQDAEMSTVRWHHRHDPTVNGYARVSTRTEALALVEHILARGPYRATIDQL